MEVMPLLERVPSPIVYDAVLLDLLMDWVPDEKARQRVLVDNPAVLYGFGKA